MSDSTYHLAQINIARAVAPMDDPAMQGFVEQLEYINSVADSAPGFVWRLQTEDGDATEIDVFGDELVLFNMSVWESIEALEAYVYRSNHVSAVQKRAEWFERPTRSALVLWWIEAGEIPTIEEGKARLEKLWLDGPTAEAFTFRRRFDPA